MNRLQSSALRSILLPAVLTGLLAAGQAMLANNRMAIPAGAAGFCFGFLAILGIMTFEIMLKPASLGKLPLWLEILAAALLEVAFLLAVFDAARTAFWSAIAGTNLARLLQELDLVPILVGLAAAALVLQYVLASAKMLGRRNLLRFLGGHYRNPREQECFIVQISLSEQTAMTERYGQAGYLQYRNAFAMDLEKAAINCRGEILQQLPGGVVLQWRLQPGEANNACISFVFRLHELIQNRDGWYQDNFNQSPHFRASLHFGPVFRNEAGWRTKRLLASGSALDTLAKLDNACSRMQENFLVSDTAMDHLILPAGGRIHRTINARLRDEAEAWRIFALEQISG